jgi:type IV fimbrial biogenesis protein FimT
MLSIARRSGGFTLIELMVTITLIAILMLLAVPAFGTWSADSRVRSAAESLQNALRLAQSSAVARSRTSMLALTSTSPAYNATPVAGGSSWYAILRPLSDSDETYSSSSLIASATVASQYGVAISGPALLCFSSLGQQTTATYLGSTCTAPTDDKPVSYTLSRTGAARSLKVLVYLGGRVRMCDAAKTLSDIDPDGCPA